MRVRFVVVALAVVCVGAVSLSAMRAGKARNSAKAAKLVVMQKYTRTPQEQAFVDRIFAEAERKRHEQIGTQVTPRRDAAGETLRVHKGFSDTFNKLNTVPPARSAHFQWIQAQEGLELLGWQGMVTNSSPIPGGYRVTIQIRPMLNSNTTAITFTPDYVIEIYDHTANGITLVGIEEPPPGEHRHGMILGD